MPEIGEVGYLLDYLSEIGEAKFSGDFVGQIDWQEIIAWSSLTDTHLTPGETLALRRLSSAYVDQFLKSKDRGCFSPVTPEIPRRDLIAQQVKSMFSILRSAK